MTTKDFGAREGEQAVELPTKPDAGVYFIGRIHTPWNERKDCPRNARGSDAVCTVVLDQRFRPGLKDVETCTHLVLLYCCLLHISEPTRRTPISYAVFCLKKK